MGPYANPSLGFQRPQFMVPVRWNSLHFSKWLKPGEFPSEPTSPIEMRDYARSQDAANKVRFRTYWDAELRASVHLNEFLTTNTAWFAHVSAAIDETFAELRRNKGEQLRRVLEVSDEREARYAEIIDQHEADGIIKYYLGMLMIDPASAPATYQVMLVALRVAEVVVMCLKEKYREARPSQVCPVIMPLIDPPVTPTFPAGHALKSHLISKCLETSQRLREQRDVLYGLSSRIAENRVVAGLHYPLDNQSGVIAADECFKLLQNGDQFAGLLKAARQESANQWPAN
jgi:hypothetical protein